MTRNSFITDKKGSISETGVWIVATFVLVLFMGVFFSASAFLIAKRTTLQGSIGNDIRINDGSYSQVHIENVRVMHEVLEKGVQFQGNVEKIRNLINLWDNGFQKEEIQKILEDEMTNELESRIGEKCFGFLAMSDKNALKLDNLGLLGSASDYYSSADSYEFKLENINIKFGVGGCKND